MYHGMGIMTGLDLVFTGESANALELILDLLYQVISGTWWIWLLQGL